MKKALKEKLAALKIEEEIYRAEQTLKSIKSNKTRGRSINVGNAFGGVSEVSIRGDDDSRLWVLLQPTEVIELIHQLASSVGCHIHVQPRDDFASWRNWNIEKNPLSMHPPQTLIEPNINGLSLDKPEEQPGFNFNKDIKNVVAIKETVNKRSAKRTTKSS
jgi:hypothetical protein